MATLKEIASTAALGLEYDDTLVLLSGNDTAPNKQAWMRGRVKYKFDLLKRQRESGDVRLLIFLGKHYLGQEPGEDAGGDFDVKVILDGDAA